MTPASSPSVGANTFTSILRWLVVLAPMAFVVGSAVTLFLWLLDEATNIRLAHPWLLWLLPAGGALVGWMYSRWGNNSDKGTQLIIEEMHQPGGGIPTRMAPLVLFGTLVTHLFGGSAGREGTAVQMGGSLASAFERRVLRRINLKVVQLKQVERRELLQAGIAAGFGAVFGTPLAGAVFALEVLSVRRFGWVAIFPCLLAAVIGDRSVALWGVHHTIYPRIVLSHFGLPSLDAPTLLKVLVAATAFGLAARLFLVCAHGVSTLAKRWISVPWMRPVVGGCVVIALFYAVGSADYLGLGVIGPPGHVSIVSSFEDAEIPRFGWLLKLIFTTVTVGSGFKGGEVTPLFFIGATLGNAIASVLHAPFPLFAALGFVAVFGAAAKTPIACTFMGFELFGVDAAFYIAVACGLAFLWSGRKSLYSTHAGTAARDDAFRDTSPDAENPLQPKG
ncbi:MAG: voltage-gated chloride channel family protein [Gemmatimonadaceae bacterium]